VKDLKKTVALLVFMAGVLVTGFTQQQIIVSAAASLTDVLTALQPAAETFVGTRILFNFGASGVLRRQVEDGAPVDVFFSAAAADMDTLEKEGMIVTASRRNLLSNAMVLVGDAGIAPPVGTDGLRALLTQAQFLAVGNPDSVPAGRYAVQALAAYGLYPIVEHKLVLGGNVREVLQFVESGSAPLGIVFVTDALSVKPGSPVRQLYIFPKDALKTLIVYPVAVVSATKNGRAASKMIEFLQGHVSREAFRAAGFIVTPD
jgi:molybdate transport system substrate-binding protein